MKDLAVSILIQVGSVLLGLLIWSMLQSGSKLVAGVIAAGAIVAAVALSKAKGK